MSSTNLFGKIVTAGQVEQAVALTLTEWINTYLGEIERVDGWQPDQIQRPLDVITRSQFEKWPEEQVPVIVVMTPGLADKPVRKHDGAYDARWAVGIAAIVSDTDKDATRRLALSYAAAIRLAVGQHKMLRSSAWPDGFANGSWWEDETYQDLPSVTERSLGAARVTFQIGVDDVMTEYAGPRTPLPDPDIDPGQWLNVTRIGATVTPLTPLETVS